MEEPKRFRSLQTGETRQFTFWNYFRRAFDYKLGIRINRSPQPWNLWRQRSARAPEQYFSPTALISSSRN